MSVALKNPDPLLSKQGVAHFLNVNSWTIDRWRKTDPTFPAPFWLTDKTPRWLPVEIQHWLATRLRGGVSPEWRQQPKPRRRKRRQATG